MTYRERLIEVMARAAEPGIWDSEPTTDRGRTIIHGRRRLALDQQRDALAAAERAGFEFRKKEIDGE